VCDQWARLFKWFRWRFSGQPLVETPERLRMIGRAEPNKGPAAAAAGVKVTVKVTILGHNAHAHRVPAFEPARCLHGVELPECVEHSHVGVPCMPPEGRCRWYRDGR
jgi:hypothetical protein